MSDSNISNPKTSFRNLLHAEQTVQEELLSLQQAIYNSIRKSTLHGVKVFTEPVRCAIVPFSVLTAQGTYPLDPNYFLQSSQADAVSVVLARKKTAADFLNAINTMLEDRCARIGKNSTPLNSETLRVLQSFYDSLTN